MMVKNNGYILVIGSLNYDIIFKQKRLPKKGETYTGDSVDCCGGGKGGNQAVQCAKLGLPVIMCGKVGADHFGDYLVEQLECYGADTRLVGRSDLQTGLACVNALEDGSVHATITTGANGDFSREDIDRLDEWMARSRMVVLQLEIPVPVVEYIIEKAEAMNVQVVLNAAPAKEISAAALEKTDYLIVNETEAGFYLNRSIEGLEEAKKYGGELASLIKKALILTVGADGALLFAKGKCTHFPAVNQVHVVETTGAGDSFIGGFLYGKYTGMSDEEACKFASYVSAVTIQKVGAQSSMPALEEIDRLLSRYHE